MYRELLIGCGHRREKLYGPPGSTYGNTWQNLVTLDRNEECKPDLHCNLDKAGYWNFYIAKYVPGIEWCEDAEIGGHYFLDNVFDEIHAYEVLEHLGRLGDEEAFFNTFAEIYRILKPNGWLFATCPSRFSPWMWGDPSHKRVIQPESLVFLDQREYTKQCDNPKTRTPMSDFRYLWGGDFNIMSTDNHETHAFALQAIKPSRITKPGTLK